MSRAAFVIGNPIVHSRSPLIHRFWLSKLGLDGSYDAIDIAPPALPEFVSRLRDGHFAGGNVTIPHKQAVLPLCDEVDAIARQIGAVNTLVLRAGILVGSNTDWLGFLANLDENASGWDKTRGSAIVLGAGGAARGVVLALTRRGLGPIHVLNRTELRAKDLATDLSAFAESQIAGHDLSSFADLAPEAALLVNTSAIGMHGTGFGDLDLCLLPAETLVTDIVYTPLETQLLAAARQRGLKTVDGLGMLLHQAVPGFEAWFGRRPEVTPDLRALIVQSLDPA